MIKILGLCTAIDENLVIWLGFLHPRMHTNRREINLFLNSRSLASIRGWFAVFGAARSRCILFATIRIREALLWQHEIADNRSEITAARDELSQGTPSGTKRIESFYR
jgi:hypothetical protein